MTAPRFQIKGLKELQKRWSGSREIILDSLRGATQEAVLYVHSTVPPYPPPPALSTYRRTGTLGRSIHTEVRSLGTAPGYIGTIGTNIGYSPWVISSEKVDGVGPQARIHVKTGWWTLQGVVERAYSQVIVIYNNAVQAIMQRL